MVLFWETWKKIRKFKGTEVIKEPKSGDVTSLMPTNDWRKEKCFQVHKLWEITWVVKKNT